MKKIFALAMIVMMLCLALTACGKAASDLASDISTEVMSTNGVVTDGDGIIGNETVAGNNDADNASTTPTSYVGSENTNNDVDMNNNAGNNTSSEVSDFVM